MWPVMCIYKYIYIDTVLYLYIYPPKNYNIYLLYIYIQ